MARIQPVSSSSENPQELQKQAVYTVWMKSLVFNGNGCTVYGADGGVAFRVDNYGCRGAREVFFMDGASRTLLRIQRTGFGAFKRWAAFRYAEAVVDGDGADQAAKKPWFSVQKVRKNGSVAAVKMHGGSGRACYRIEGCSRKSDYRISGADDGAAVAAITRKQTASGVVLGEDVLTLTVGSGVDHLLVLGLVVVCGLMNRCL